MAKIGSAKSWFLTIHENAECFNTLPAIVEKLDIFSFYAFIRHEKDEDDDIIHYHLVFSCKGRITLDFAQVQETFKGAHIETCNSIEGSTAYLTHSTYKARKEGKRLYNLNEVFTNDRETLENLTYQGAKEPFIEDKMLVYINEGTESDVEFFQRFGGKAFKEWGKTYKNLKESTQQARREQARREWQTAILNKVEELTLRTQDASVIKRGLDAILKGYHEGELIDLNDIVHKPKR